MQPNENNTPKKSHNVDDEMKEIIAKYVDCDRRSAEINDERAELRDRVKELGHDPKALQDNVARLKKDRRKKQGYDESHEFIRGIVGTFTQGELLGWMDEREIQKQKARDERNAKADSFKPAPERKPKEGKVIKSKAA